MIIPNFEVHSILRAYSQQQGMRFRMTKDRTSRFRAPRDEVTLSPEGKMRWTAEKISGEIVHQILEGSEPTSNTREILDRLSREFGKPLKIEGKSGGDAVFMAVVKNENGAEEYQVLTPAEAETLKENMFDIAKTLVYSHLREGAHENFGRE